MADKKQIAEDSATRAARAEAAEMKLSEANERAYNASMTTTPMRSKSPSTKSGVNAGESGKSWDEVFGKKK
jgi:hypothetical protein